MNCRYTNEVAKIWNLSHPKQTQWGLLIYLGILTILPFLILKKSQYSDHFTIWALIIYQGFLFMILYLAYLQRKLSLRIKVDSYKESIILQYLWSYLPIKQRVFRFSEIIQFTVYNQLLVRRKTDTGWPIHTNQAPLVEKELLTIIRKSKKNLYLYRTADVKELPKKAKEINQFLYDHQVIHESNPFVSEFPIDAPDKHKILQKYEKFRLNIMLIAVFFLLFILPILLIILAIYIQ